MRRPVHIVIKPSTSKITPALSIESIGTMPEPYTMAFGGVDTGSMKPKLAPRQAPNAGGRGDTPAV